MRLNYYSFKTTFLFSIISLAVFQLSCSSVDSKSLAETKSLAAVIATLKINPNSIYIFIDKSDYQLTVMADSIKLKSYPVVFGGNTVDDKLQQGDGCTPEGWFKIKAKYPHKKWSKFMWIDYPNAASQKKFNAAVAQKKITATTDIGGDIGIHGVPEGTDAMIDKKYNWTLGCISLKNKDINELYGVTQVGTKVFIQK